MFFSASFVVGIYLKGLKIRVIWGELSDDMAKYAFFCVFSLNEKAHKVFFSGKTYFSLYTNRDRAFGKEVWRRTGFKD